MSNEMMIGLNGLVCRESEAFVSVYDHGFLYGIGLFETFRTYGGQPFLFAEHMHRLYKSCHELDIAFQLETEQVKQHIADLLQVNRLQEAYVRLAVSAGTDVLGLPGGDYEQPNTIVYVKPLPEADPMLYETGKALQLLKLRRSGPEGKERMKSFHYMNNVLAKRELMRYPWANGAVGAEGLFLNDRDQLSEGIVSNLFFIRNGVCYTPAVDTGILPGITRACVIELAGRIGVEVVEGHFSWQDLLGCDEVFVTGSVQGVVPITKLYDFEGRAWSISEGRIGPATRKVLAQYLELARRE